MKTPTLTHLLTQVRRVVLEEAAKGNTSLALTWVAAQVTPHEAKFETSGKMTGLSPKKLRGHVQHALTILATQGLVFSRTRPEPCVQPHEHGERDKRFHVRIRQEEAKKILKGMKCPT